MLRHNQPAHKYRRKLTAMYLLCGRPESLSIYFADELLSAERLLHSGIRRAFGID